MLPNLTVTAFLVPLGVVTIAAYALTRRLFVRSAHPLPHPVFAGTVLIIALLRATGLTFADYRPAADLLR